MNAIEEKSEICHKCKSTTNVHYEYTDGLGYWIFSCDKCDTRPFYQEYLKLKALILLVDPAVSMEPMNDLSVKQWNEFVRCFPNEDD